MGEITGFIMSLISASAAFSLIDGFIPDGGIKKYVKYLASLVILLVLISPLRSVVGMIPEILSGDVFGYYDNEAVTAGANTVVATHIERALCEKFSINDADISVTYNGERITVETKSRPFLYESDIRLYIVNNFGVYAEVHLYE